MKVERSVFSYRRERYCNKHLYKIEVQYPIYFLVLDLVNITLSPYHDVTYHFLPDN